MFLFAYISAIATCFLRVKNTSQNLVASDVAVTSHSTTPFLPILSGACNARGCPVLQVSLACSQVAAAASLWQCRCILSIPTPDRFVGLEVRRPPRERKIPVSNPACTGIFSGSSHTSDSKIGTPVATLPGAWRYRVSAGTGRPGVSIL